jgi:hypothetical protein
MAYDARGQGGEGLGAFRHIAAPTAQPAVTPPAPSAEAAPEQKPQPPPEPWGPVPTDLTSLSNVAPGLLPFFNNAPVFGLPGTVVGDFWHRTQLTGDWGGLRTDLARQGFFFDLYTTSVYQNLTSGGLMTGSAFVQNTQFSMNVDTGRAGLWSGGLFHFTVQSRYGDPPQRTFTAGSFAPQYTGFVEPDPLGSSDTLPSEYFFVQAFGKHFSVILGKISDVFIPDQTLFGDSYKYYFANFNLNKNPITTEFYHPTAWAALGVWVPSEWLVICGGVLDPNSRSENFATNAYDHVNLFLTAIASYKIANLPGQFSPSFNWSNQSKINLTSPFGALSPAQVPQAVGVLAGSGMTEGLPIQSRNDSWFVIANLSQYLCVWDDSETVAKKLKSDQPIQGLGVFGRLGYAAEESNPVTRDASIAIFAHGPFDRRPYDSVGVGAYYNVISRDTKGAIAQLTEGTVPVKNEKGIEVFYDFAITPAVRIIPSYQHIWDPFTAQVAMKQNHADVFQLRLNVAW